MAFRKEKQVNGISVLSVSLVSPSQLLNQVTDIHEIWFEATLTWYILISYFV
jgi:hypothetical protein